MREALLPLAESVADGTSIDWDAIEKDTPPEDRAFLKQLSVLARLSEIHRTLDEPAAPLPVAARRSQSAPAIGTWAHLTLLERLGGGTFGEVYRAWDRQLEREVALKLLKGSGADDPETSRITREGRLLARVRHPNVITVHGVDVHEGRVGLWMELLRGQTLEQQLHTRGKFSAREAALVGIDLCRALAAIHAASLLHRDVKAENVIREEGGRIVLMDLGTGREIDPLRRGLPDFAGTPLYLAPEIFDGAAASAATDVYSLGVLLYHLVTGSYPIRATTVEELKEKHANASPVRLRDARADLPTGFVAVIDRAIARDPKDRYPTAGALEADLLKSLDAPQASSRRRAMTMTAILAAIVIAGALLAWPALRGNRATPVASAAAAGPIRSIAVLPLVNMSGDGGQEYFADGMTDELIGTLGRLQSVNVISRTSSMQFKGTNRSLPEIARALNVDAVVEGTVMMVPGGGGGSNTDARRLRINARLIRAGTDTQLWDRTFEAASADVLKLQREIASAVADGIHATLAPVTNAAAQASVQGGFDAFDLYLKGRYYWAMRTPDALKQSVQYFQEAVRRGYTPAYAGLADAYNILGFYGVMPLETARRNALDTATKGLERDPSLAEAYASRGFVEQDQFNWQAAEADFRRSIDINPAYATGHQWYALFLAGQGRLDEALGQAKIAAALDPLSVAVNGQLGWLMLLMHQYDDAIVHMQQTVTTDPGFARNRLVLAEAYALNRDYDKALMQLDDTSASGDEEVQRLKDFGYVYGVAGRRADALKIVAMLQERESQHAMGAAGAIATVYTALGDRDRAFAALTRAWTLRDPIFNSVKVDPLLDSLHSDARFAKLLATAGLPQ